MDNKTIAITVIMPVYNTSMYLKQAIESIGPGEILEVLADDPGAEKDIKAFARRTGHTFISAQRLPDGSNRILIRRKEN